MPATYQKSCTRGKNNTVTLSGTDEKDLTENQTYWQQVSERTGYKTYILEQPRLSQISPVCKYVCKTVKQLQIDVEN